MRGVAYRKGCGLTGQGACFCKMGMVCRKGCGLTEKERGFGEMGVVYRNGSGLTGQGHGLLVKGCCLLRNGRGLEG